MKKINTILAAVGALLMLSVTSANAVEFKTEIQLSLEISSNSEIAFSYNHISNASLGDKNPGANSYMFNFLKNF